MSIEFRTIEDRDEFGNLREAWNDLARRSPFDHAFQRHEWFSNWWDHLPHGGRMRTLTGWRDGRLVAAVPLYTRREHRRRVGFELLSFMQSSITPRTTFLIDPAEEPGEVFAAILGIPGWDLAEFKAMERPHPLNDRFVAWLGDRGGCVVEPGAESPYQQMPADWATFEKSRRKSFRKRFRNGMNRCRAVEGFRVRKIETYPEFESVYADLVAVSRNSWKAEGGSDLGTQSCMAEFFRDLARETADERLWVLFLMEMEGKPVAFGFAVRHGGHWVLLRWDFDEAYRYYMPGVVVHIHALQDLLESHQGGEYDLSGTDTDFKAGMVDGMRGHMDVTFGRGALKSRILMAAKKVFFRSRKSG